ncbi:MAG TPA: hypothetical protein VNI57_01410 [Candidatus Saccharimonadales bacterium]|nr:hypothetical protein [Candidatus Saccharimonadales bacterium]
MSVGLAGIRPFIAMPKHPSILDKYAKEAREASRIRTLSTQQLYERAAIPRSYRADGKSRATKILGQLVVPGLNRESGAVTRETVRFNGWRTLNRIRESEGYRRGRGLIEAGDFFDQDALPGTVSDDSFHPLMGGPFNRNLYLFDMLDMFSKCFEAKNHHPLARQIVRVIRNYTIGHGIKAVMKSDAVNEAWMAFEKQVKWQKRLNALCDERTVLGDTMLFHDWRGATPYLRVWDASTVWEIVTDPQDIETVHYYHRQFPTQWQMFASKGIPSSEYVIEQVPPELVFHLKGNEMTGEKRGRSDLLPSLGWLKRHTDIMDAMAVRSQIEASFVWRTQVQGSDADVARLSTDPVATQPPTPGARLFENDKVKTEPLAASIGTGNTGILEVLNAIVSLCATSVSMPPEWLGVSQNSARNTGLIKQDPSTKFISARQEEFLTLTREVFEWWSIGAQLKGLLPKHEVRATSEKALIRHLRAGRFAEARAEVESLDSGKGTRSVDLDLTAEFLPPDIVEEDRDSELLALGKAASTKVISHRRYAQLYVEVMKWRDYDYEQEQKDIQDEEASGVNPMTFPFGGPPGTDGQGGDPEKEPPFKPGSSKDNGDFRDRTLDPKSRG